MPENELTRMMEYVRQRNKESGMPLGQTSYEEAVDNEGFSPAAPAPALVTGIGKDEEMALSTASPKKELEAYQLNKYPPSFQAVDLQANMVTTTHGKFPLNDLEVKQISAACVSAMQRSFESILQTLVEQAGLSVPEEKVEGGNAQTPPNQDTSNASTTSKSRRKQLG